MQTELNTAAPGGAHLRETVRTCNRLYWMGAREAAQVSPQYAETVFGVTPDTAEWLLSAPLEAVLDLAEAPVVTFRMAVTPSAVDNRAPRELRHLHMALGAAGARRGLP